MAATATTTQATQLRFQMFQRPRCPDCGGPVVRAEGCSTCPVCGHSRCG